MWDKPQHGIISLYFQVVNFVVCLSFTIQNLASFALNFSETLYFSFIYMCRCLAYMCVCAQHVCLAPMEARKRASESLEQELTDVCEQLGGCWDSICLLQISQCS